MTQDTDSLRLRVLSLVWGGMAVSLECIPCFINPEYKSSRTRASVPNCYLSPKQSWLSTWAGHGTPPKDSIHKPTDEEPPWEVGRYRAWCVAVLQGPTTQVEALGPTPANPTKVYTAPAALAKSRGVNPKTLLSATSKPQVMWPALMVLLKTDTTQGFQ